MTEKEKTAVPRKTGRTAMLYTPKYHIPLGEIHVNAAGQRVLVIKKAQSPIYEEVAVTQLCDLLRGEQKIS